MRERSLVFSLVMVFGIVAVTAAFSLSLVSADDFGASINRARGLLAAGIAFAAFVGWRSVVAPLRHATTLLRELKEAASAMQSDLSIRTRLHGEADDEIIALGGVLDRLVGQLAISITRLSNERDRLEQILETMVEGVLLTDAKGAVVLANASLRTMVGSTVRTGKQPIEVIRNDQLADIIERAARQQQTVSGEIDWLGPVVQRVRVRAAPLASAESPGVVAVLSDVTDLRRLEAVRRDFVANVSHELRTPVAAIRAAIETLEMGASKDPATTQEFLDMIARHSARLHQLVEDLLELSRIEAQRLKLQPEPIELIPFFEHLASLYSLSASRRSLALRTSLGSADLAVLADRRALEQILSNLIDNAIKYSTPGAVITVSAVATADDCAPIAISVADTGPGIMPHHLPRLFERFYRVDRGRSRDVGGTGLGLAIVKHLTEVQGGNVEVESTPGRGSVFTVRLPAARQLVSPSEAASSPAPAVAGENTEKALTRTGS